MMQANALIALPVYPPLVAATIVTSTFVASTAALPAIWRPLILAAAITLAVQGCFAAVLRDRHLAAASSAVAILTISGQFLIAAIGSLAIAIICARRWMRHEAIRANSWIPATRVANVIAILTLAMVGGSAIPTIPPLITPLLPTTVREGAGGPDIYVLIVDGHPRPDTLAREFGYDSAPFLSQMADLGFEHAAASQTNYGVTILSMASFLGMTTADRLVPVPPRSVPEQYRLLGSHVDHSASMAILRRLGYEVIMVPSPFSTVTVHSADRTVSSGGVTDFELALLQQGLLPHIFPEAQRAWLASDHRRRVLTSFDAVAALAGELGGPPRVVLAHIMAPHSPFVFDASGGDVPLHDCFPQACSMWRLPTEDDVRGGYVDQVAFVDDLIVATATAIVERSRTPPVVLVLSDHGHRHDPDDPAETVRSLFLARTPGIPGLFPEDVSLSTVMARLLNAYHDTDLPLPPDDAYFVDLLSIPERGLFDLRQIDPDLID